jgi:hypothetical protein
MRTTDGVLPKPVAVIGSDSDGLGYVLDLCFFCSFSFGVAINRVHTTVFVKPFPEKDQKSKWHQGEYCEEEVKYKHLMSLYAQTVTTTDR